MENYVCKKALMRFPIEINDMRKLCRFDADFHAENARFPHQTLRQNPQCERGLTVHRLYLVLQLSPIHFIKLQYKMCPKDRSGAVFQRKQPCLSNPI